MTGTTGVVSRGGGGRIIEIRPDCIRDEVKEVYETWYSLCLAPTANM